jgi:hypothetical protein
MPFSVFYNFFSRWPGMEKPCVFGLEVLKECSKEIASRRLSLTHETKSVQIEIDIVEAYSGLNGSGQSKAYISNLLKLHYLVFRILIANCAKC